MLFLNCLLLKLVLLPFNDALQKSFLEIVYTQMFLANF